MLIDKFILSDVNLQTADDGNTTYWGGTFNLILQCDGGIEDGDEYYFQGSDRENSPEQCIIEMMERLGLGEERSDEQHDLLYGKLSEYMGSDDVEKNKLLIIYDYESKQFVFDLV